MTCYRSREREGRRASITAELSGCWLRYSPTPYVHLLGSPEKLTRKIPPIYISSPQPRRMRTKVELIMMSGFGGSSAQRIRFAGIIVRHIQFYIHQPLLIIYVIRRPRITTNQIPETVEISFRAPQLGEFVDVIISTCTSDWAFTVNGSKTSGNATSEGI